MLFTAGSGYLNSVYRIQTSFTTDRGVTWHHDTLPDSIARAGALAFDPFEPNRILLAGDSNYSYKLLLLSTDLGTTWVHTGNGLIGAVYCLAPGTAPGRFFAGTAQGLFISEDGGNNWSRTGNFAPVRAVCPHPENDSLVYAGTDNGVYLTTDRGTTWLQVNEGLLSTRILSLALRPRPNPTVFAGTNGAGIFAATPPTGTAEPAERSSRALVLTPNPSAGRINLILRSGWFSQPSVRVYDRTGRLLFPVALPPGKTRVVRIDLRTLPAGTYFLRLKLDESEVWKPVVIAR